MLTIYLFPFSYCFPSSFLHCDLVLTKIWQHNYRFGSNLYVKALRPSWLSSLIQFRCAPSVTSQYGCLDNCNCKFSASAHNQTRAFAWNKSIPTHRSSADSWRLHRGSSAGKPSCHPYCGPCWSVAVGIFSDLSPRLWPSGSVPCVPPRLSCELSSS